MTPHGRARRPSSIGYFCRQDTRFTLFHPVKSQKKFALVVIARRLPDKVQF